MTCVNINPTLWTDNKVFMYVNIRNSVFIEATVNIFSSVTQLYLNNNGLTKFCMISNINRNITKVLDISENEINSLMKSCLNALKHLVNLNASYNCITHLSFPAFHALENLLSLDISFNCVLIIPGNIFQILDKLKSIILSQNNSLKTNNLEKHKEIEIVIESSNMSAGARCAGGVQSLKITIFA